MELVSGDVYMSAVWSRFTRKNGLEAVSIIMFAITNMFCMFYV